MASLDLDLHVEPQPLVERAERLVEQQHGGLHRQRACHRHPLLLAAGELSWQAVTQGGEAHHVEKARDRPAHLRARNAAGLQAVGDVLGDRHVRKQRVALEYDAHVAGIRGQVIDRLAVDPHRAGRRPDEAGHHAEQRGLAAARGTEQGHDLAGAYGQRDVGDGGDGAVAMGDGVDIESVALLTAQCVVLRGSERSSDYSMAPMRTASVVPWALVDDGRPPVVRSRHFRGRSRPWR